MTVAPWPWLAFWVRDRHRDAQQVRQPRPTDAPVFDTAGLQTDVAIVVRPLAPVSIASGRGLAIHVAPSDVQPAGEKDEAILYRPEHAQHLNDKPQI
jgi:hypothetical protein